MVHIAALYADVAEVGRQVLGHFFGQRRHQAAQPHFYSLVYLADEVVYLPLYRADEYLWIEQSRRADDLLHDLPCALTLIFAGRCGYVHALVDTLLELLIFERPVIEGRGQAEAVLNKRFLARPVAAVHCAHLRQSDMALVHKQQKVLREIVKQRHRRAARRAVRDYARIVLDAGAVAQLLHHLDVVIRALADALRLDELVVLLEPFDALVALAAYLVDGGGHLLLGRDIVTGGIYRGMVQYPRRHAGHDVYLAYAVYLVAEEFNTYGLVV